MTLIDKIHISTLIIFVYFVATDTVIIVMEHYLKIPCSELKLDSIKIITTLHTISDQIDNKGNTNTYDIVCNYSLLSV
jgi:uncharacterized protein Smg (DUF494 family)